MLNCRRVASWKTFSRLFTLLPYFASAADVVACSALFLDAVDTGAFDRLFLVTVLLSPLARSGGGINKVIAVLDDPSASQFRAVLAVDLKGAFDNVSHDFILDNLAASSCGPRAYNYVHGFLRDRTAAMTPRSLTRTSCSGSKSGHTAGLGYKWVAVKSPLFALF